MRLSHYASKGNDHVRVISISAVVAFILFFHNNVCVDNLISIPVPLDQKLDEFPVKDDNGTKYMFETQRVLQVLPCDVSPDEVYIVAMSKDSVVKNELMVYKFKKGIIIGSISNFCAPLDNYMLIFPKGYIRPADNNLECPCISCGRWIHGTYAKVDKDHPLCALCYNDDQTVEETIAKDRE